MQNQGKASRLPLSFLTFPCLRLYICLTPEEEMNIQYSISNDEGKEFVVRVTPRSVKAGYEGPISWVSFRILPQFYRGQDFSLAFGMLEMTMKNSQKKSTPFYFPELTMGDVCVHYMVHKWRYDHEIFERPRFKRQIGTNLERAA